MTMVQEELYKLTTEPLVDALYMGRSGKVYIHTYIHTYVPLSIVMMIYMYVYVCMYICMCVGLLFAYGVTNAGKTFTIMGTPDHPGT